jgi:putative DNA primase/helicase
MGSNRYQCKCPAHNDDKASLTITDTNDKILIHCHAGCSTWDIMQELGLKMGDLYKGEKPPETWQENFEQYKKKQIEEAYHYTDENGMYLYTKLRMTGKDIVYGRISSDKTFFKMGINNKRKVLYNLPATIKAINMGYPIYFV